MKIVKLQGKTAAGAKACSMTSTPCKNGAAQIFCSFKLFTEQILELPPGMAHWLHHAAQKPASKHPFRVDSLPVRWLTFWVLRSNWWKVEWGMLPQNRNSAQNGYCLRSPMSNFQEMVAAITRLKISQDIWKLLAYQFCRNAAEVRIVISPTVYFTAAQVNGMRWPIWWCSFTSTKKYQYRTMVDPSQWPILYQAVRYGNGKWFTSGR